MEISKRISALEESQTLKVAALCQQMRAEGVDVIGLSLGEPDFPAPAHVKQAAIDAVKQLSKDVGIPEDLKDIVKVSKTMSAVDFLIYSWKKAYDLSILSNRVSLCRKVEALLNKGKYHWLEVYYYNKILKKLFTKVIEEELKDE